MTTSTPEYSRFDPYADYLNTLASFGLAFAQGEQDGVVFETAEEVGVLAGSMMATKSLSYLKNAERLHLVVTATTSDYRTTYRYQLQHMNAGGEFFGDVYTGVFLSNFGEAELKAHTEREGKRVRDWLANAQFEFFEAMAFAPEGATAPSIDVTAAEELKMAKEAARRDRTARWLAWLGLWNPWRYRKNK